MIKKLLNIFIVVFFIAGSLAVPTHATSVATGTQKVIIVGEDWGPGVLKTIVTLDKNIDASSLSTDKLKVEETKSTFDWVNYTETTTTSERIITNVYLSDASGNKIEDTSGSIFTIEMEISPSVGSPFIYNGNTGRNDWCSTYELAISLINGSTLTNSAETIDTLSINESIDLTDSNQRICIDADEFDLQTYTGSKGTTFSYGEYTPTTTSSELKPLIIWLHGGGEGGTDNYIDLLANKVTSLVSDEFQSLYAEGAYVITPQTPTFWMNDGAGAMQYGNIGSYYTEELMELIENYVANHPDIDPERIIIGGCSNGGYMTMEMILTYPEYFAAAFPICEYFYDEYITDEQIQSLIDNDLGIWFVYAKNDGVVDPTKCSQPTYERLIAAGATNVHISTFENVVDTTGAVKDESGNAYEYNGHWSWIYFFNNECVSDVTGENAWQWLSEQTKNKSEQVIATGNQKLVIVGDDWGPAVSKTIITLDKPIEASSINKDNFKVTETKNIFDWSAWVFDIGSSDRTILDVYLSDSSGNKVTDSSGNILTIEMYVSPSEGSPFLYNIYTGFNNWCETYKLDISLINGANLLSGDETIDTLSINQSIDLTDPDQRISLGADEFNLSTFTGSQGTTFSYGEYVPTSTSSAKVPLVIWLHGAGEGGSDNYIDLLGNEVTSLISDSFQSLYSDGAYILTPQSPTMWMDDGTGSYQSGDIGSYYTEELMELIEYYVANNPNIDTDRIIIGGCSNGGYMTMEMILTYPEYFAAAYPICEAFSDEYISDDQIQALIDNNVGIWFTYAENDTTVNPELCTKPTYERLINAGATNVHISSFDNVVDTTGRFDDEDGNAYEYAGHWSWIYFFNNECYCDDCGINAWVWLAQQTKTTMVDDSTNTTNDATTSTVKTGDDSNQQVWISVSLLGLGALAVIASSKKRASKVTK